MMESGDLDDELEQKVGVILKGCCQTKATIGKLVKKLTMVKTINSQEIEKPLLERNSEGYRYEPLRYHT